MDSSVYSFPEFETQRLKIVKYKMEFVQDAFQFYCDEETMRYAGPDIHKTISETEIFVQSAIKSSEEGTLLLWAVVDKTSGKMMGDISLHPDYKHKYASLGSILNKHFLHKGIMTEATSPILEYAFHKIKLNRIEAQICTKHIASIKYVEKLGFINEGLLKQNFMIDGKSHDSFMYALLKEDFK